jgi:hypothetical protein
VWPLRAAGGRSGPPPLHPRPGIASLDPQGRLVADGRLVGHAACVARYAVAVEIGAGLDRDAIRRISPGEVLWEARGIGRGARYR